MHNLKELKIWLKAIDLAVAVYKATETFPKQEQYGLTLQIRRAVVSIASNIAEGAGRNSNKEFAHFLGISNGSSYELMTQLILSSRVNMLSEMKLPPILRLIDELQKMNYGLQETIRNTTQ